MDKIEEQFFKEFNISKYCVNGRNTCKQYNRECTLCPYYEYPDINEYLLLEIICRLSAVHIMPVPADVQFVSADHIKREVLQRCIDAHCFTDGHLLEQELQSLLMVKNEEYRI